MKGFPGGLIPEVAGRTHIEPGFEYIYDDISCIKI